MMMSKLLHANGGTNAIKLWLLDKGLPVLLTAGGTVGAFWGQWQAVLVKQDMQAASISRVELDVEALRLQLREDIRDLRQELKDFHAATP